MQQEKKRRERMVGVSNRASLSRNKKNLLQLSKAHHAMDDTQLPKLIDDWGGTNGSKQLP
jgi:hypothetical protein